MPIGKKPGVPKSEPVLKVSKPEPIVQVPVSGNKIGNNSFLVLIFKTGTQHKPKSGTETKLNAISAQKIN